MDSQKEQQVAGSSKDTALLIAAFLLIAGGLSAFYYFIGQFNVLVRTLMLLASRVAPGPSYYAAVLGAVVVLQAAGALLLWQGSRRGQREVAAPVRPHAP